MKRVQDILVTVERTLNKDPRPCCLACLGVASQEMCIEVEKYVQERLSTVYTVENGICYKRDHRTRVIHPREAAKPLPKL